MKWNRTLSIVAIALASAACRGPEALVEDPGILLATDVDLGDDPLGVPRGAASMVWSSDSREVFFRQTSSIHAVDAGSAATRHVADVEGTGPFAVSPDGAFLYFVSTRLLGTDTPPYVESGVFRLSVEGGAPEQVGSTNPKAGSRVALSPDGGFMAYQRQIEAGVGDLTVYDLALDTEVSLGFPAEPLRFSPDGTELLASDYSQLMFFGVDGGSFEPWVSVSGRHMGLIWASDPVELVQYDYEQTRLVVIDRSGQTTRAVDMTVGAGHPEPWAVSPDGTRVAFWRGDGGECINPKEGCDTFRSLLLLVDMQTGSMTTIGTHHVNYDWSGPWWMAFSPDGSRLAYRLAYDLYAKDVP